MSDETQSQIEHLIEITKQDFQVKASLLEDNVEGHILVAELLQDIKLDVSDIKDGLFQFFEEEQDRFVMLQGISKEQYFRTLEALRESKGQGGQGGQGVPENNNSSQGGAADGGGGSGVMGALGAVGAGLGIGALARFLTNRFLPFATVAAAVTGVIDYYGSRPEILAGLADEGLTGADLEAEATTQTLGKVMSDFSDNVIEPLVGPLASIAAKEFGFNNEEIIKLREEVANLSGVFERGTESLVDDLFSFFGRESSSAAQRDDDNRVAELGIEMREAVEKVRQSGLDANEVEAGLTRLDQIESERQEITSLPFTREPGELRDRQARLQALGDEQRDLEDRLDPELERQRIEKEIGQAREANRLSQAGYAAGELQTDTQLEFQQTPSDKKEEYYKNKIGPDIKGAIESGALSRSYYNTVFNEIQDYGIPFGPDSIAIPVAIEDFKKIEDLTPKQIEAILTNDDILLNSIIMKGALETSDREAVEQIYRIKTEGVPQLDAGGTIKPGEAAIVGERGPEIVLGPAEVVGREDTVDWLYGSGATLSGSGATSSGSSPMLTGASAAQVNQTTVQQPIPVIVTNAETAALSITPSPTISAAVPVDEMSKNVSAASSAPIVIASTQGGSSSVTNMVNNNSTNILGGSTPARSSDVGHRRYQDRMQGVV